MPPNGEEPRTVPAVHGAQHDAHHAKASERDSSISAGTLQAPGNLQEVAPQEKGEPILNFANLASWQDRPIREREWAVANRIPARNVTLLSGEGGCGKTTLAQQLAVAAVSRKEWLGIVPDAKRVMMVCCEDDDDELHRRFVLICKGYGVSLLELSNLWVKSFAGEDALLATLDKKRLLQPTKLFKQLVEAAQHFKPDLIVIDNAADTFGGDENDRVQVRRFISLLRYLAIKVNAAVVLTSHPSLTGASSGTGLSGSTAWHASVRARLYMKYPKSSEDDRPDPNERELEMMKSNYGPKGEVIALYWKDGLFMPTALSDPAQAGNRLDAVSDMFLKLLAAFESQGRNVGHKRTSPTFAPTAFSKDPLAKKARMGRKEFDAAMNSLFSSGKIHVEEYGRPSRPYSKIVAGPHQNGSVQPPVQLGVQLSAT